MPKLVLRNIIVVNPNVEPVWMSLTIPENSEAESVRTSCGTKKLKSAEWKLDDVVIGKVLWSEEPDEEPNPLASKFCEFAGGRCFFVGSSQKLTKDIFARVNREFLQIIGKTVSKRMEERNPVFAKDAQAFFVQDFIQGKKSNANKSFSPSDTKKFKDEAIALWQTQSETVVQMYQEMENKDRQRFENEKKEMQRTNPQKPKAARNAYHMYCAKIGASPGKQIPEGKLNWKEMTEQDKEPYTNLANQDKLRFAKEYNEYVETCEKVGKVPDKIVSRKSKPREGNTSLELCKVYEEHMRSNGIAFPNLPPLLSKKRKISKAVPEKMPVAPAVSQLEDESDDE